MRLNASVPTLRDLQDPSEMDKFVTGGKMSVVHVDFRTKSKEAEKEPITRIPFSFELLDSKTGQSIPLFYPLELCAKEISARDILNQIRTSIEAIYYFGAQLVIEAGLSQDRDINEIAANLIIEDLFIGLPGVYREQKCFLVEGIKYDSREAMPSWCYIYAVCALEAELHAYLRQVTLMGLCTDSDLEKACAFIDKVECSSITNHQVNSASYIL